MIRNLKVLGLALVALLAMSAVVASAASAHKLTTNSGSYPQTLTGSQIGTDVFTTNAGTVSCTGATYHGSISAAAEEPEATPTYTGCTAFGFVSVPIDVNGCKYRFHANTTTTTDTLDGTVDIVCGGSPITITAPGCTVTVGSQNGLGNIEYTNTTSGGNPVDVDIEVNISKSIVYTVDSGCSTTKAGTFGNGSYTGKATVEGETAPIWID